MSLRAPLAGVAATVLIAAGLTLAAGTASAAPLPLDPTDVCETTNGVGVVSPVNPEKPLPIDNNVSVYAGGNFTRTAGSELEGKLVVNGNATIAGVEAGAGRYDLGMVGGGSGLIPTAGSEAVLVGGDLLLTGAALLAPATMSTDGTKLPVNVKVGGSIDPTSKVELIAGATMSESLGQAAALGVYASYPDDNFAVLRDLATRNADAGVAGTYTLQWGTLTLANVADADRITYTIPASEFGGNVALDIGDIAPTTKIIIKVTGATAGVSILDTLSSGASILMGTKRFGQLASQTMWTFPDATNVTIGGAQFPGTVVVPTPGSNTVMSAAGMNGRMLVAGNLDQNRQGSEFHAFPFNGDEFTSCKEPRDVPTPTDPVPTDPVPTDPVPTDPVPTDPVPTDPAPTDDPVPTDDPTSDPVTSASTTTTPEAGDELALTGSTSPMPLLGAGALMFLLGAVLVARRRTAAQR